ncbi:hypothetical protein MGWOODY_Clf1340 [hydrothermal vent metagenome]|uniref:Uncharacterized protein n=1 Tax=hydrothermal vent metagenome TaxID=652676 RepID=A0A160VB30_9ZZZZ
MPPSLRVCNHHVDVVLKQQRSGYAIAGQPGYGIGEARSFGQSLVLDAGVVKQGLDVFDALDFVAQGLVVSKLNSG